MFFWGQVEVAANFEAWNLTKEEMNLLTSQDQVLMDQFPMLNNINGASGLGNLDRWHWLDTPARYEDFFSKWNFSRHSSNLEAFFLLDPAPLHSIQRSGGAPGSSGSL